jgi:hypothetical protein
MTVVRRSAPPDVMGYAVILLAGTRRGSYVLWWIGALF